MLEIPIVHIDLSATTQALLVILISGTFSVLLQWKWETSVTVCMI